MFDHHKDIELAKGRGDDEEEVARNDRLGVIAQEGRPTLIATRQTRWVPRHVLSDSPWRNPQPKFQEQFVGNALFAPDSRLPGAESAGAVPMESADAPHVTLHATTIGNRRSVNERASRDVPPRAPRASRTAAVAR